MRSGAIGLTMLLLVASVAGCAGLTDSGGRGGSDYSIDVPTWHIGDWWLYTFSTPEYTDDTARLVVASDSEEDGTAYMLAISSIGEARRHAVLNHNPFLGRITHDNLSAYENGLPQPVLTFPISEGDSWTFPYSLTIGQVLPSMSARPMLPCLQQLLTALDLTTPSIQMLDSSHLSSGLTQKGLSSYE